MEVGGQRHAPANLSPGKIRYQFTRVNVSLIIISIQPFGRFWQEPEPSQATGMALARCILGKF
jgi:hypothetical protein